MIGQKSRKRFRNLESKLIALQVPGGHKGLTKVRIAYVKECVIDIGSLRVGYRLDAPEYWSEEDIEELERKLDKELEARSNIKETSFRQT